MRGVTIPALDPDPESDFQLVGFLDSNPVKSGITTPIDSSPGTGS